MNNTQNQPSEQEEREQLMFRRFTQFLILSERGEAMRPIVGSKTGCIRKDEKELPIQS